MSRTSKIALAVVALLVAIGVGTRWRADASAPSARVGAGEIRAAIVARAVVVPARGVSHVVADVAGHVTRVDVRVGDEVEAGQVLAAVEPSERDASASFDLLGEDEALRAPIAGVVLARHVEPGDALSTLVPSPLPLFVIADPSQLELRIEIDERAASRVEVGTPITVGEASSSIERLAPRIERREHPLDDVASRARADVRLAWAPVPEGVEVVLGQHLDVRIEEPPLAVEALVPREAVEVRNGRAIVRVRGGAFASETEVTLGACDDEHVEVHGVPVGAVVLTRESAR
jgi:biotin carboxyl carrier protein